MSKQYQRQKEKWRQQGRKELQKELVKIIFPDEESRYYGVKLTYEELKQAMKTK